MDVSQLTIFVHYNDAKENDDHYKISVKEEFIWAYLILEHRI